MGVKSPMVMLLMELVENTGGKGLAFSIYSPSHCFMNVSYEPIKRGAALPRRQM